jgi:uroporphyrinogen III methyltransferase/synthase
MNPDKNAPHGTHPSTGIVYLVGAGPGDPGLLTLKGRTCLEKAEVVIHDRLVHPLLLSLPTQAAMIDVGKRPDCHRVPQEEINQLLIDHGGAGKIVVRLKGGDPFVFGRGGEEAAALAEAGIPYEVVPGVTSPVAGPAYAGIPVTHRELARSVAFITGHHVRDNDSRAAWQQASQCADTLVFLMGVKNLPQIVQAMLDSGRPLSTPVTMVRRGTYPDQISVEASLETIEASAQGIEPPALIIVGDVAALGSQLAWLERSPMKPLRGMHLTLLGHGADAFDLGLALFDAGAEIAPAETGDHERSHGALVFNTGLESGNPKWLSRFSSSGKLIALDSEAHQALAEAGLLANLIPDPASLDLLMKKVAAWRTP